MRKRKKKQTFDGNSRARVEGKDKERLTVEEKEKK